MDWEPLLYYFVILRVLLTKIFVLMDKIKNEVVLKMWSKENENFINKKLNPLNY